MRPALSRLIAAAVVSGFACSPAESATDGDQAALVDQYAAAIVQNSPIAPPNLEALRAAQHERVRNGDGTQATLVAALAVLLNAIPGGHNCISPKSPDPTSPLWQLPSSSTSRYGVCARPHGDHMIVTRASPENRLGLKAGDRIVAANGLRGGQLVDWTMAQPTYGCSRPSPSSRRYGAATTFFAVVAEGMQLEVIDPSNVTRAVPVPAPDSKTISCRHPFEDKPGGPLVRGSLRPDGIGVVKAISFSSPDTSTADSGVEAAFLAVRNAKAIVIDSRGNPGGDTSIAYAIANQFRATKKSTTLRCVTGAARIEEPPAQWEITNDGPPLDVPVALLMDGLNYSAGDVLPTLMRLTPTILVGAPTSGTINNTPFALDLVPPAPLLPLVARINQESCYDDVRKRQADGVGVEPDLEVEYDAADLAAGRDTVLETAVAALMR
jgi:hypothetical protein